MTVYQSRTTIRGRLRQTIQALFAFILPVDHLLAQRHLTAAEYALFLTMPRSERQHHLRVLKTLLNRGYEQPALLTAALLHDIGKSRVRFSIPERIWVVVVKRLAPNLFAQWGRGEPVGWRKSFVVSAQHPAWGAEMVCAVGSDPLVIELIRQHQCILTTAPSTEMERLLVLLQAADDVS